MRNDSRFVSYAGITVRRKLLIRAVLPAALLFIVLGALAWREMRPESLRQRAAAALTKHLNLDTTIDHVAVSFFPRPHVSGAGLVMRVPDRSDLPPFISIERFEVDIGLFSILRKHVGTVHVDGLRITVPPKDARRGLLPGKSTTPAHEATDRSTDVFVDELISHDAQLEFVKSSPDKAPLVFKIHKLTLYDIGFGREIPFDATVTNPIPLGLVETRGRFGPWRRDDPTETRLSGDYTFSNADLSTINGIGGILSSIGSYEGHLTEISARGTTETPDFSLDLGGNPVPLKTSFEAKVNGTNGSTELVRVDARIGETPIQTSGAITNRAGPGGHDINLKIRIDDGRIEDILALAIDSAEPMLTGDLSLESTFAIPPGDGRVPRRLQMTGRFGLASARFSDSDVQKKLRELSRRSQGKDKDDPIGRVMTDLRGRFTARNGSLRLSDLNFRVPGATVRLNGVYALESGAIDFRGELRTQATMSQAVGGFKSIFLKPFDFILRKDGAGAVVPIRITGTQKAPKMSVEVGRIFKGR
jgi:hypothetical protein